MKARWPEGEVNETLLKEADYIVATAHEFKQLLKKLIKNKVKLQV